MFAAQHSRAAKQAGGASVGVVYCTVLYYTITVTVMMMMMIIVTITITIIFTTTTTTITTIESHSLFFLFFDWETGQRPRIVS